MRKSSSAAVPSFLTMSSSGSVGAAIASRCVVIGECLVAQQRIEHAALALAHIVNRQAFDETPAARHRSFGMGARQRTADLALESELAEFRDSLSPLLG